MTSISSDSFSSANVRGRPKTDGPSMHSRKLEAIAMLRQFGPRLRQIHLS
jgi:hypothetical protein